jgi:hypothetical protein
VTLRGPRTNERRPDTRCGDVRVVDNIAESWYHAAQFEWETGEYRGFTGRASYTFGKALDTGAETTDQGIGDVGIFPARDGKDGLYTPGRSLMTETAASTATNPSVAYDCIWFKGDPVAQIDTREYRCLVAPASRVRTVNLDRFARC